MAQYLTPEQLEQWNENGFLILPQVFDPQECRSVQDAVNSLYDNYLSGNIENLSRDSETATTFPPNWDWIDPKWDRDAIAFRRWNIVRDDSRFIRLVDHPCYFPAIVDIMGPRIQVGMTHAIVLPSGMKDRPYLHVDGGDSLGPIRPDPLSPPLSVRVQIFLTDLDADDMGNFMAIPGSHRHPLRGDPLRQPVPGMPAPVQFRMRAGDALLFTHALWHGAAANNSERARKTLIYGYIQRFLKPYDYEQMCPEVLSLCTPRQRLLLGDLGGWHWRAGCHYYEGLDYVPTIFGTVQSEPDETAPLRTGVQAGRAA